MAQRLRFGMFLPLPPMGQQTGHARAVGVEAARRPRIPCPPVRPGKQSGCRVCESGVAEILWAVCQGGWRGECASGRIAIWGWSGRHACLGAACSIYLGGVFATGCLLQCLRAHGFACCTVLCLDALRCAVLCCGVL